MSSINVTKRSAEGGVMLTIEGILDEHFDVHQMHIEAPFVVIDFKGVKRISSFGVRQWMTASKYLKAGYVCYVNVSPAIIVQFNSVAGFGAGGVVVSVISPYVCTQCAAEFTKTFDLRQDYESIQAGEFPSLKCPSCKSEAEFDDLPEVYYSYVLSQPIPTPPAEVCVAIDGGSSDQVQRYHVEQDVGAGVTALWLSGKLSKTARLGRIADSLEGMVAIIPQRLEPPDDPAALPRLLELYRGTTTGLSMFTARLPLPWLRLLGQHAPNHPLNLVSVLVSRNCEKCGSMLQHELLALDVASNAQQLSCRCLRCYTQAPAPLDADSVNLIRQHAAKVVPHVVTEYLDEHRFGPPNMAIDESGKDTRMGKYTLLRMLGEGGMAEVFLARQDGMGGFQKKVVVKRILPHLANDSAFITLFLQEAKLAARIDHPNVIQTLDVGRVDGQYYIALEYLAGADLDRLLRVARRDNVPMSVGVAARIVADICAGLAAAHTWVDDAGKVVPIIHRDVSPHNVLVGVDGRVKVSDFGIARAADVAPGHAEKQLRGKLSYMAPEQLMRVDTAFTDPRIDIFAAGVVLYLCLALRHPFRKENDALTKEAILHQPIPDINSDRSGLPEQMVAVVNKALAKTPTDRFVSAFAMKRALEDVAVSIGKPATIQAVSDWVRVVSQGAPDDFTFTAESSSSARSGSSGDDHTPLTTASEEIKV